MVLIQTLNHARHILIRSWWKQKKHRAEYWSCSQQVEKNVTWGQQNQH